MKKIYLSFVTSLLAIALKATSYTVSIVGTSYSPATLSVTVGDVITIQASSAHPLVQVDQSTWNANGNTPMAGGWGTKTSDYTFTVTTIGTIYYVCSVHVGFGMKGQINVSTATAIKELNNVLGVSVYPNPVKEKLTIKFSTSETGKLKGKLFNACGAEIPFMTIEQNYESGEVMITYLIPEKLPEGVYLLDLVYGNKKSIHKLVVE